MPKKSLVKINDVGVYDKNSLQLANLNLDFFENDSIALVGPNGAGKTTIAKIITSEILPATGFVNYAFDIKELHQHIGYQFRHNSWPNGYKTKDVINLYKYIYNVIDDEWFNSLFEVFNLQEIWHRQIASCSYIWHQIISMVLAIIRKPKILIVDSISSIHGLDEKIEIINFLKNYQKENSALFLFLSPDEMIVRELCNRVVGLDHKKIVEDFYIKNDFDFNNYQLDFFKKIKAEAKEAKKSKSQGLLTEYIIREKAMIKIEQNLLSTLSQFADECTLSADKINFKNILFHSSQIKYFITKMQESNNYSVHDVLSIKREVKKIICIDKKMWKHIKKYPELWSLYEEFEKVYINFLKHEFKEHFKFKYVKFNKNKFKIYNYKKDSELKKLKRKIIATEKKKLKKEVVFNG